MKFPRSSGSKTKDGSDTEEEESTMANTVVPSTAATPKNMKKKAPSTSQVRSSVDKGKQVESATKDDRAALVGFSIFDPKAPLESRYRQVRAPMGGGIRHIRVSKSTTKSHMLARIRPLFFLTGAIVMVQRMTLPWTYPLTSEAISSGMTMKLYGI